MTISIVFTGNCQMDILCQLYRKFASGVTGSNATFIPTWTNLDTKGREILDAADIVVEQITSFAAVELPPVAPAARIVRVPLVSGSFLWPFAGSAHPRNTETVFLSGGPYPGELGDGFLNRAITEGLSPEVALERYRGHDLGGPSALDRRYELTIEQQMFRDEICGFSIAGLIEKYFRTEHLFLSPHHPGVRISIALAGECFTRLNVPDDRIQIMSRSVRRSPFPGDEQPIHPRVAAHFRLSYAQLGATFAWRGEGRFTWDEWVVRYMNYDWSPALFEGCAISETDPARARRLLATALERLPASPMAHAGLARALCASHDYGLAIDHLEVALRLDPDDPETYRLGALIYAETKDLPKAIQYAADAVVRDPGNVALLILLANLQQRSGDHAAAESTLGNALELSPNRADLITEIGTTLLHQERYEDAVRYYNRSYRLDPTESGALFGASLALGHLGQNQAALDAVKKAIALRAGVAPYHSHLGHLLLRQNRRTEAISAFQAAVEHEENNAGLHDLLTDLILEEDPVSTRALYHARRAAECDPGVVRYLHRLAELFTRHSRVSEAIATYGRLFELAPQTPSSHSDCAALYRKLDRLEEARANYAIGLGEEPSGGKSAAELAAVLLRMGNLDEALTNIEFATRQDPANSRFGSIKTAITAGLAGTAFVHVPTRYLARQVEEIFPGQDVQVRSCLRYTNFPDLNPSFGNHHLTHLYVDRLRWVPPISLCILPSQTLLYVPSGEEFLPIVGNRVVAEQVRSDWSDKEIHAAVARCERRDCITEPAVLIGRFGIRTWGHWLGELLPQVLCVEAKYPKQFRFVLPARFLHDPVHRTAMESLVLYGITADRLIFVAEGTRYDCSELHMVTPVWSSDRMVHPEAAALMRALGYGQREPEAGWLDVALLRRATRTRRITNLPEVERTLIENGFAIVDIEHLSFGQQVDLFKNARSIVSVLGSGLAGLLYAPKKIKVLTLAPAEWGDAFFYSMMQDRDAAFADIRGRTSVLGAGGNTNSATAGFAVPIDALEAGLARIEVDDSSLSVTELNQDDRALPHSKAISRHVKLTDGGNDASVVVIVEHESAMVGDTLNTLPFILALAERHKCIVHVRGQFNRAVADLVVSLPISFEPVDDQGPIIFYTIDVKKSFGFVGPHGLHTAQGYFVLAGMKPPELPITLPLQSSKCDFPPGFVISPFCGSESADSKEHKRVWYVDRWHIVIDELLALDATANVYVVGGPNDDASPYIRSRVIPVIGHPLSEVLNIMQRAHVVITIDTGTSHLAHYGGIFKHVLLYSRAIMRTSHQNPRATVIQAWPDEISPDMVLEAVARYYQKDRQLVAS